MGTTAAQKKLFFNLRRMKSKLDAFEDGDLKPEDVTKIATDLGVAEHDVVQHEPPDGDGRRHLAQRADARRRRGSVAGLAAGRCAVAGQDRRRRAGGRMSATRCWSTRWRISTIAKSIS